MLLIYCIGIDFYSSYFQVISPACLPATSVLARLCLCIYSLSIVRCGGPAWLPHVYMRDVSKGKRRKDSYITST